jgi:hypothetical protein
LIEEFRLRCSMILQVMIPRQMAELDKIRDRGMLRKRDDEGQAMTGKKLYALGLLALISFFGAVLEAVLTGRVEPFGKFDLVESLLSLGPLYWWYYLDKEQRQFSTGVVQNLAVIGVAAIGLPVYIIRSRGWRKGGIATALALGVWAALVGLGWLGEELGLWLAG